MGSPPTTTICLLPIRLQLCRERPDVGIAACFSHWNAGNVRICTAPCSTLAVAFCEASPPNRNTCKVFLDLCNAILRTWTYLISSVITSGAYHARHGAWLWNVTTDTLYCPPLARGIVYRYRVKLRQLRSQHVHLTRHSRSTARDLTADNVLLTRGSRKSFAPAC